MFQFVSKKLTPWRRPAFSLFRNQDLCFLQFHHFSTSSKILIPNSNKSEDDNKRLFIIDYLTKTCGMSPKSTQAFSKYLTFETGQKPDSVISFFKQQGFTGEQISCLIRKHPLILSSRNPDMNLLPKFEFFRSIGLSTNDIAVMISRSPRVLGRSLEKQIIPVFKYITSLLQSHEKAVLCIQRFFPLLIVDIEDVLIPNVEYLGEVGVPHENVVKLVRTFPSAISFKRDHFRKAVDEVKSMGCNPLKAYFTRAVYVYARNGEKPPFWKNKVELYKSYGLSDNDVLVAFRRYPFFMTTSIEKIGKVMDYFVKRIGCEPSLVVKRPEFVSFSLEKRIVPRWNVYQVLLAKDLVPKKFNPLLLFRSTENKFLCTFVEPFEAQVPGLLMMYKNSDIDKS